MIIFKDFLAEAKSAPLYHGTTFTAGHRILSKGAFNPVTGHVKWKALMDVKPRSYDGVSYDTPEYEAIMKHNKTRENNIIIGISASRSFKFASKWASAKAYYVGEKNQYMVFEFDQLKVATRFKIIPIQHWQDYERSQPARLPDDSNEYEEFIVFRGKPIKVYHGTSLSTYKNSISKYGLQANKGVDYADKIKGHSEHNVYFTHSLADARKYAVRAGGGRGSVILEVELHDLSRLVFDEDQLKYGFERIPANVLNEIKMRMVQLWPNQQVLAHQNDPDVPFSHKELSPWVVRGLFAIADTPAKRNVLSVIGSYAIGSAPTFAYKGQILPRYIKVVETFKSTAAKEVDPEYDNKYDKVMSTFKSTWK